jgi:hypothetical protein
MKETGAQIPVPWPTRPHTLNQTKNTTHLRRSLNSNQSGKSNQLHSLAHFQIHAAPAAEVRI